MKSDGILDPRRAMKIHFMSQKYEFAQICSRFVAVYLRLHLKICTLQKVLRTNRFAILRFQPLSVPFPAEWMALFLPKNEMTKMK